MTLAQKFDDGFQPRVSSALVYDSA